jgi:hypothetical protein
MKILTYEQTIGALEYLMDKAARGGPGAVVGFDMESEVTDDMYLFRDGPWDDMPEEAKK